MPDEYDGRIKAERHLYYAEQTLAVPAKVSEMNPKAMNMWMTLYSSISSAQSVHYCLTLLKE